MKAKVFIMLVNIFHLQKKKSKNKKKINKRKKGFIARIKGDLQTPGAGTEQEPQRGLDLARWEGR